MSHFVTGLVAKPEILESFSRRHSLHSPIALGSGLAILPLRDDDLDTFLVPQLTGHPEGFTYLCDQLAQELKVASTGGAVLYFETEYFGGEGTQGAVVFQEGTLIFGPKSADLGPINEALALLGVRVAETAQDEFQTVGLDRYRHTEDWLEHGV